MPSFFARSVTSRRQRERIRKDDLFVVDGQGAHGVSAHSHLSPPSVRGTERWNAGVHGIKDSQFGLLDGPGGKIQSIGCVFLGGFGVSFCLLYVMLVALALTSLSVEVTERFCGGVRAAHAVHAGSGRRRR